MLPQVMLESCDSEKSYPEAQITLFIFYISYPLYQKQKVFIIQNSKRQDINRRNFTDDEAPTDRIFYFSNWKMHSIVIFTGKKEMLLGLQTVTFHGFVLAAIMFETDVFRKFCYLSL